MTRTNTIGETLSKHDEHEDCPPVGSVADLPDSGDLHGLRVQFLTKHRECEKAAYALACALPIGAERSFAFDLYEIICTAPREAQS